MISLRPIVIGELVSLDQLQVVCDEEKRTNSRELGSDMQNHDDRHAKRNDVHERCGALENEGIRDFDIARIAVRYDPRGS